MEEDPFPVDPAEPSESVVDAVEEENTAVVPAATTEDQVAQLLSPALPVVGREDLPFLVTNWLAHFQRSSGPSVQRQQPQQSQDDLPTASADPERQQAIRRIHRAAAELSAAFHDLGSFGTTTRPRWGRTSDQPQLPQTSIPSGVVPATFHDRRRQWGHQCPPQHLEHVLAAAIDTQHLVGTPVDRGNVFQASLEARRRRLQQPTSGRTLQDAIDVSDEAINNNNTDQEARDNNASIHAAVSGLTRPLALARADPPEEDEANKTPAATTATTAASPTTQTLTMVSKFQLTQKQSANAVRQYLDFRQEYERITRQIQDLRKSLDIQKQSVKELSDRRDRLNAANGSIDAISKATALDEIQDGEQNATRVIAQLQRQLALLEKKEGPLVTLVRQAKKRSGQAYKTSQMQMRYFRDPLLRSSASCGSATLAQSLVCRPSGLVVSPKFPRNGLQRSTGHMNFFRKNVFFRRISPAVTINAHMVHPVYCLRFDRTGRYFITGADDYLSKVFCLRSHTPVKHGVNIDPESFQRGAVLVCTLRGHNGVINDIAVSSDNAFLATASEDGDCRVWGLRDGSPIAILRGHAGGALMVSWSTLTPYRLVTAGADGYARCWDIREACHIRYGAIVGKRFEYKHRKGDVEEAGASPRRQSNNDDREEEEGWTDPSASPSRRSPSRQSQRTVAVSAGNTMETETDQAARAEGPTVPLPPLPPGQNVISAQDPAGADTSGENEPGSFVAGNEIDEGVRLLSKMQHGASLEERMAGQGTRSRRAAIKVLCVDVCPLGQHVATGADDGICRVFSASDDITLERLDMKRSSESAAFKLDVSLPSRQSRRQLVSGRLLVTLKGHLTAITDLKYSNTGDRLLSASLKDGVVRIWSWDGTVSTNDTLSTNSPSATAGGHAYNVNHILIKLTNPEKDITATEASTRSNRPRPSRSTSTSSISCDAVAWFKDDSKVITSQCELVKQTSSEIQPGSQYIFIWDSFAGHCLLGIRAAHSKPCSVVLPHPFLPTIVCSAGADGLVRIWDLDKQECILEHKNTVDYGPVEARDKGMIGAYLDGSFSPDGMEVVLTDDSGRVTVLDCLGPDGHNSPIWMREQYFANDYYELCYDRHGYCIERGSEQPPHIAPRGVRCTHAGIPWQDEITAALKGIRGPMPDADMTCLWTRLKYRHLSRIPVKKILRRNVVSQFDPNTTILIGTPVEDKKKPAPSRREDGISATTSPRLSSNWRWRDYSDILREEENFDDEADADDDSFELNDSSNRRARRDYFDDDDEEESDSDSFVSGSSVRRNLRTSIQEAQPRRTSRNNRRRSYDDLEESDDDEFVEYMSSNNTPSGPFRADYDVHLFRVASGVKSIERVWVHRIESSSSYVGRKCYSPQVGDEAVYIPRAHFDVIANFPSITAPWQNWPSGAEWPVVRCTIRSIRYRFPYKDFHRTNKSVVAILTLEVTGIPELSQERDLPFPKPVFVDSPGRHIFEVSVFQSDSSDFVIPLALYTTRLEDLEKAILGGDRQGLQIHAYYGNQNEDDAELAPYEGTLEGWEDIDCASGDPNLVGSGYRSLLVSWEGDSTQDKLSPWEVAPIDPALVSEILRPRLSEAEKQQVRDALTQVRLVNEVESFLVEPINTDLYTDYYSRVENPMWLGYVITRLDADYYSTKLSVIYDVKLIRENSKKYNGDDELTRNASLMYEKFCQLLLSPEELADFRQFEKDLEERAAQFASHHPDSISSNNGESQGVVRRSRRPVRRNSALESLPAPPPASTGRRSARRRSTINRNASILEHVDAPLNLPMNSSNRGRTSRNSRGQQPTARQLRTAGQSNSQVASRSNESANTASRSRAQRAARRGRETIAFRRTDRRSAGHPTYAEPGEDDADIAESEPEEMSGSTSTRRRAAVREGESSSHRTTRNSATQLLASNDLQDSSPRRSTRRSSRVLEDDDEESSDDSVRQSTNGPSWISRSTTVASRSRRVSTPRSDDAEQGSNSQLSSRGRPKRRKTQSRDQSEAYDLEASSGSDAEEDSEDIFSEEKTKPAARKRTRSSPSRRASRARARPSYEDPSSSEFSDSHDNGEDTGNSEDSSDSGPPVTSGKRSAKRSSSRKPPKKKAKATKKRPVPKAWPEIALKHITKVGKEILVCLEKFDESGLFAVPVVEEEPHLAEDYAAVIDEPMDFRTIYEERLPRYKSIRELQQDLITVFHNCIVFNGETSDFGEFAKTMMDAMEDTFHEVCQDLDIPLPPTIGGSTSTRSRRRR